MFIVNSDVKIDYCLDMFQASLCPSSGEKDHMLLHMGLFAATREDMDISCVVFFGVACGMMSRGLLVYVCSRV